MDGKGGQEMAAGRVGMESRKWCEEWLFGLRMNLWRENGGELVILYGCGIYLCRDRREEDKEYGKTGKRVTKKWWVGNNNLIKISMHNPLWVMGLETKEIGGAS